MVFIIIDLNVHYSIKIKKLQELCDLNNLLNKTKGMQLRDTIILASEIELWKIIVLLS